MSDELRRRAGFWRKLEYDLDVMTEDLTVRSAEKWVNKDDKESLFNCIHYLEEVLYTARSRYRDVLHEQVMGFLNERSEIADAKLTALINESKSGENIPF